MDKQHALAILNSKQLENVLKLFEKYAQVQGASGVHVQDISLSGMEIAYTKEGKQEVFKLAFPYQLDDFEGIRDAIITLLGPDAPNATDSYSSCHTESQRQQNGSRSEAQDSFGGHQGSQAGGFEGHAPYGFNGACGSCGMPFGFAPFPHYGMFVMGFMPFGFHPMAQHFNHQASFGGSQAGGPQQDKRTPHAQGQQDFFRNQGSQRH